MAHRPAGRTFVGLVVEIGLIVLVVALLPKLNLRPQPATPRQPPTANSWWQAAPGARETSWQEPLARDVNVEQTLDSASQQLLSGAADYATRAAAELLQPPPSREPIQAEPRQWGRY